MKKKSIVLILSGLLILTLAGCGNSLSSGDKDEEPSGTTPTTSNEAVQEGDQSQNTNDASKEAPFRGSVVNIFDNTISLLAVKKENSDGRSGAAATVDDEVESDPKPSGSAKTPEANGPSGSSSGDDTFLYSTTGETSVINVTGDTEITLISGERGKLMDIEVGDIIIIQMYGSITESIRVESKSGVEIIESDNETDSSIPSPIVKPILPDGPKSNTSSSAEPNS